MRRRQCLHVPELRQLTARTVPHPARFRLAARLGADVVGIDPTWNCVRVAAERGTHRELLERGGLYAQMWALQQEESERSGEKLPAP